MNRVFYKEAGNKYPSIPPELEGVKDMLADLIEGVKAKQQYADDALLTTEQVMKLLHVSRRTVQNRRNSGKLRYYKHGNKICYRMSDINEMLRQHAKAGF